MSLRCPRTLTLVGQPGWKGRWLSSRGPNPHDRYRCPCAPARGLVGAVVVSSGSTVVVVVVVTAYDKLGLTTETVTSLWICSTASEPLAQGPQKVKDGSKDIIYDEWMQRQALKRWCLYRTNKTIHLNLGHGLICSLVPIRIFCIGL